MRDSTGAKITLVGVLAAGAAIGSWAAMAEESPPSIDLLAVQGPCYDVLSESQFPLMPSPGLMTAMPGPEVQPSALGVVVSEDEPVAEFARVEDELCDLLGTICQTYLTDEPDFDRLSWLVKSVADGSVVDDASVLTDSFGNISGKLDTGSSSIKARFSISAEGDYRILINPPAIDGFISTDIAVIFSGRSGYVSDPVITTQFHPDSSFYSRSFEGERTLGWSLDVDTSQAHRISATFEPDLGGVLVGIDPDQIPQKAFGGNQIPHQAFWAKLYSYSSF